uniref:Secreted protein n=1 Tax=Arundo donax TaxID=35708 RepID=A0A0A9EMB9_ARUDO
MLCFCFFSCRCFVSLCTYTIIIDSAMKNYHLVHRCRWWHSHKTSKCTFINEASSN